MISKVKNILTSRFFNDVKRLSVGTVFKLAIAFVGSIFVTRLLGVEKYGIYSIAMSFASVLMIFTRFSFAASLTTLLSEAMGKKDTEGVKQLIVWYAKNILVVNTLILIMTALVPWLAEIFYPNIEKIALYVQIYLLSVFFSGLFFLVSTLLQILRKTKLLATLEVSKDFTWRLIAIIALLLGLEIFGVVIAQLIVALIFLLVSAYLYYRIRRQQDKVLPTLEEVITDFRSVSFFRHFRFTTSITIDNNLAALYSSLPIFLVGIWSTEVQAGLLALALHLISVPKALAGNVSKMLSSVLPYKKGHDEGSKHDEAWIAQLRKVSRVSFPVLAGVFVVFAVFAYYLIPIIYGQDFAGARMPLIVLVLANLGIGFTLSLGPVLRTIKRVGLSIITNAVSAVVMAGLMYWLIPLYGAVGAALGMLGWKVLHWTLVWYMFRILKQGKYEKHSV